MSSISLPRICSGMSWRSATSWLISITTLNRVPVFADQSFGGLVAAIIEESSEPLGIEVDLYCLLPDHAHVLLRVVSGSVVDYVRDLKSLSTRAWWAHGGTG